MNDFLKKLENPIRINELNAPETLKRIGLTKGKTLCDIGAGSGIFTIPAAGLTEETIYATELNEDMMAVIADKAKAEGITNIKIINANSTQNEIKDDAIDIVLLVCVLHEIDDTFSLFGEVKRFLKNDGKIAIIEFHKKETTIGPPVSRRLSNEETIKILNDNNLVSVESFDLGENFYCMVFKK